MIKLCLFCEFVSGERKNHNNGLPLDFVNETENTISFLSKSCPEGKKAHILVIPKEHFSSISELPSKLKYELIDHVSLAIKVIKSKYDGCNILVNDGKEAEQVIPHLHFHIVPREKNDGYKIEDWPKLKVSKDHFLKLTEDIKRSFNKIK